MTSTLSLECYQTLWLTLALHPHAEESILVSQESFSSWLKTQRDIPETYYARLLDIPLKRWQQYAFMVKSNLQETLKAVYPYTFKLLDEHAQWLIDTYLIENPPKHYLFLDCVETFPKFLSMLQTPQALSQVPFLKTPLLADLAQYEWFEACLLKVLPLPPQERVEVVGSLLSLYPILNPHYYCLNSTYDIPHCVKMLQADIRISENDLESLTTDTSLWIYLDHEGNCRFYKVNALVLAFLKSVEAFPHLTCLEHFETFLGAAMLQADVQEQCLSLLEKLVPIGILHVVEAHDLP